MFVSGIVPYIPSSIQKFFLMEVGYGRIGHFLSPLDMECPMGTIN